MVLGGCVSMSPPASEIPEQKSQWLEITEICAAGSTSPAQKFCPPPIARETRAAWVATVANIDWPSRSDLTQPEQVAEITRIVDRAAALKLNMLVLQVRPAGDAMYRSALEPWSEFLTGAQGRAPSSDPTYDPLQEWINQAHRRGIALHAWFNPYRARHPSAKSPLDASHIAVRKPSAVQAYSDMLWMDPAHPDASEHSLAVIEDVVRRYDIDGVHIDDYFYPYPVTDTDAAGKKSERMFPDDGQWNAYLAQGGKLARADWRRSHVDDFVRRLYARVHLAKPWVQVGISPFGVGKPDRRPAGISGFSQYDSLYADVEKWLENGWLDYLAPQLYWPIAQPGQSFPTLLQYWISQNPIKRHIWPGLYTSRILPATGTTPWPADEISEQLKLLRQQGALASGHIHFSMKSVMEAGREGMLGAAFLSGAIPPATPWLGAAPPREIKIEINASRTQPAGTAFVMKFPFSPATTESAYIFVQQQGGANSASLSPPLVSDAAFEYTIGDNNETKAIAFTPISRTGIAGRARVFTRGN